MNRPVFRELAPIRLRRRWMAALQGSAWGLCAGSILAIGLGLLRGLAGSIPSFAPLVAIVAGPAIGGLIGLAWRQSWRGTAAAVDASYGLKDRILTALSFVTHPGSTAWADLQVADALEHLAAVEPKKVVPLRVPRALPFALGALLLAVALIVWPAAAPTVEAGPSAPLDEVLAEAAEIEDDLKEFSEIARQEQNPELEELVEELRQMVEEMKQPGVDTREALAKLSEMQNAMQAQAAKYNVAAVDAQLESLGNALQAADALQSAGKAMAEGKHEKAAEELQKQEEPELDRKEAKALEEKLKKLAEQMGAEGFASLSQSASKICEGCKGNSEALKQGLHGLAKECRSQGTRKKIASLLRSECDKLGECKCNCQSNSLAKGLKKQKSNNPSTNWGSCTSGNIDGDPTALANAGKMEQLTGEEGEGESEIETTHSPEGRQEAARSYKDRYQQYRKLSESVLDSEPIPLGHRQTIRRYFELIRPSQADASEKAPAAGE